VPGEIGNSMKRPSQDILYVLKEFMAIYKSIFWIVSALSNCHDQMFFYTALQYQKFCLQREKKKDKSILLFLRRYTECPRRKGQYSGRS
jgi:hypothetical protein